MNLDMRVSNIIHFNDPRQSQILRLESLLERFKDSANSVTAKALLSQRPDTVGDQVVRREDRNLQ